MKHQYKGIRVFLLAVVVFMLAGGLSAQAASGTWKKNHRGWWYAYSSGDYAKNKWEKIGAKWYHFDKNGYMEAARWVGHYYVGANGAMLVNTVTPDGYGVDANGKYIPPRWEKTKMGWTYRYSNGTYPSQKWEKIGGKWYYFGYNEHIFHGQITPDGYYVDVNGAYVPGTKIPTGAVEYEVTFANEYALDIVRLYSVGDRVVAVHRYSWLDTDPTLLANVYQNNAKLNAIYAVRVDAEYQHENGKVYSNAYMQLDRPSTVSKLMALHALDMYDVTNPSYISFSKAKQKLQSLGFSEYYDRENQ